MSGDVQPRKRKDKRRKKDEMTEEILPPTKNSSDEIIHVHKEIGLGGNVVTKLIFFALLMGLGVMVGFIFTEYRGRSDEEAKSAIDSPWSVMLEGWVENADAHDIPVKLNKVPERKSQKVEDESDEEMFPEAIAALQQEQEEIEIDEEAAAEEAEEEEKEAPIDEEGEPLEEEETSGKSKKPQTETVDRVEVLDAPKSQPPPRAQPVQEVVEEKKVVPQQASQPPAKVPSEEESEDESEIDLTEKKYQEILARYGQPATPESSDVEPSDDEAPGKEYSEGEDESVGEEESGGEMEGSEPEEEPPVRTVVPTKQSVPSESEDEEEEEEESEDEIPVLTPRRPQGGPKSEDEDYMYGDITNEDDWLLREQLDDADNDINNAGLYY